MLAAPKLADVIIIATQDRDHYAHTIPAIRKGYHVLLEKPISPLLEECVEIREEAKKHNRIVVVCHVLRYTEFFRQIKRIIGSGKIGEVRGVNQIENVAYWHYAHSFVRGNWHNCEETSPMILAKCCHDLDIIQWLLGSKPVTVSSQGSLIHFIKENAPVGSAERCSLGCSIKETCPYNAERFYYGKYNDVPQEMRKSDWILNVICENNPGLQKLKDAMLTSNYGKCVYRCDNNVVDHQVVNIQFENNAYATLTMSAFNKDCYRQIRVFGTKGEIEADDKFNLIKVRIFGQDNEEIIDVGKIAEDLSGHGGGDMRMMNEFLTAVANGVSGEQLSTTIEQSVMSHVMAFAAEKSRLQGGEVLKL
jgi:predicted dehydrogenase